MRILPIYIKCVYSDVGTEECKALTHIKIKKSLEIDGL